MAPLRRMKVVDLSEKDETKGILGTLLVGVLEAGKLVADGEVNAQMQIYYEVNHFEPKIGLLSQQI
jgi:hypothetical protein